MLHIYGMVHNFALSSFTLKRKKMMPQSLVLFLLTEFMVYEDITTILHQPIYNCCVLNAVKLQIDKTCIKLFVKVQCDKPY